MINLIKRIKILLLKNHGPKQTIVKNTVWLGVSQLISRLIRALIIIYAARILGTQEYGLFSYALGLAGFFTIFVDIGINQIMTREINKNPEQTQKIFSTAFFIKIILLLFSAAAVLGLAPYFSSLDGAETLLPWIALLVFFDNLREFSSAYFRSKEKMELEALVTIATNVFITAFGFWVLSSHNTANALTMSYVLSAGAGAIIAFLILKKEFFGVFRSFDQSLLKPILSSALPIAILVVMGAFLVNIDIIMLGWWKNAEEIGLYSAGQKIIQVLYTIPAILASATFPNISRLVGGGDKKKTALMTQKSMAAIFFVSIPIAIGGVVLAEPIINFLYGNAYINGVLAFQFLTLTVLFVFPSTLINNLILAHDEQKKIAKFVFLTAVGNVLFNAFLIPKFGGAGAAFATLLVQALYFFFAWRLTKKLVSFSIKNHLKNIALASIVMGLSSWFLSLFQLNIILIILISILIYLIILTLLKEELIEETKTILQAIKKSPSEN